MYNTKLYINFFDADPAGVLFFGNIFRLAHLGYEKMLADGDLESDYFFHKEFLIPIIKTDAEYHKPILPGYEVNVDISVSVLKTASFELTYLFKNDTDEVLAKVKTVHVFVNKEDWKKTQMPEDLFEYLSKI